MTDEHHAPSGIIEPSRARLSFPRKSHPCPFERTSIGIDITSEWRIRSRLTELLNAHLCLLRLCSMLQYTILIPWNFSPEKKFSRDVPGRNRYSRIGQPVMRSDPESASRWATENGVWTSMAACEQTVEQRNAAKVCRNLIGPQIMRRTPNISTLAMHKHKRQMCMHPRRWLRSIRQDDTLTAEFGINYSAPRNTAIMHLHGFVVYWPPSFADADADDAGLCIFTSASTLEIWKKVDLKCHSTNLILKGGRLLSRMNQMPICLEAGRQERLQGVLDWWKVSGWS